MGGSKEIEDGGRKGKKDLRRQEVCYRTEQ